MNEWIDGCINLWVWAAMKESSRGEKHKGDPVSRWAGEALVHQLSTLFGALLYKQVNSPQGDGMVAKKQNAKHIKTNQKT